MLNAETPVSTTDNKRINYNRLEASDFVFNNRHGIREANYKNLPYTQESSHSFYHSEFTKYTVSL